MLPYAPTRVMWRRTFCAGRGLSEKGKYIENKIKEGELWGKPTSYWVKVGGVMMIGLPLCYFHVKRYEEMDTARTPKLPH